MNYFVLQSIVELKEGQQPYHIPGLKNELMQDLGMNPPTQASISFGILEWLIPNTTYNQAHISLHYGHFKILAAGKERLVSNVALMPDLPPIPEVTHEYDLRNTDGKPVISPKQTQKLKIEISKKLDELGVKYPKNSSLQALEDLLMTAMQTPEEEEDEVVAPEGIGEAAA